MLKQTTVEIFKAEFDAEIAADIVTVNITKKEHTGDFTIVAFPLIKFSKKNPEQTAEILGTQLKQRSEIVASFNVVKGFLNLELADTYWLNRLQEISNNKQYGTFPANNKKVVLEYGGPNTNKPLHIGHVRNMLLGFSMSEILKATGHSVTKVNIYNDRGINISKSMVTYLRYGNNSTPESTGIKGDHFVGDWYVLFNTVSSEERITFYNSVNDCIDSIVADDPASRLQIINRVSGLNELLEILSGKVTDEKFKDNPDAFLRAKLLQLKDIKAQITTLKEPDVVKCVDCIDYLEKAIEDFLKNSIFSEAVSTVQKWEAGDEATMALWKKMNGWVYEGFNQTFHVMGVDFQKDYYESETYKLGKDIIEEGLQKNIFYKRADGAIAVDLTPEGLDEKVLLRSDGTAIYITQDLGTAQLRYEEFGMEKMIYVVANEQDYHFKVLKLALQKLGKKWAEGIYHLSYALVESPTGRFKSREGKTADADDLINEVLRIAEEKTKELGKIEGFSEQEANALYRTIGLGALKYFVLRVNPFRKIIFNPEESIDFHGHTGPFIQYTHARICAIGRKAETGGTTAPDSTQSLHAAERELIIQLCEYENVLLSASEKYDPSELANYVYNIAKLYNRFYHECPILTAPTEAEKQLRVSLSKQTGAIIKKSMNLLGIEVPEKM